MKNIEADVQVIKKIIDRDFFLEEDLHSLIDLYEKRLPVRAMSSLRKSQAVNDKAFIEKAQLGDLQLVDLIQQMYREEVRNLILNSILQNLTIADITNTLRRPRKHGVLFGLVNNVLQEENNPLMSFIREKIAPLFINQ